MFVNQVVFTLQLNLQSTAPLSNELKGRTVAIKVRLIHESREKLFLR